MNVAVVGASNKPDRYSYRAVRMLREKGHTPYPVHPSIADIDGVPVWRSLSAVPDPIDTVSIYLSAHNQEAIAEELLNSGARRFIFNPGAENLALEQRLRDRGKIVLEACTLVLLTTGQFDTATDARPRDPAAEETPDA